MTKKQKLPECTPQEIAAASREFNGAEPYDPINPRYFLHAIRAYRERTGLGLADAKRAMEQHR